ncbi:hypothetical protein [Luteimonas sp. 100069]|uniref:hypothetical protein n=1 Tax=Luteimonas sp. 100069 TaxID=2006109 RepID=UPI000F5119EE|nr:hypothetical protein [Luteimonas sp. 100069]
MPVQLKATRDFSIDTIRFDPTTGPRAGGVIAIRRLVAQGRQRIMSEWLQAQGARSAVGLPVNAQFPTYHRNGRLYVEFRGGRMSTSLHEGGAVTFEPSGRVRVTLEGYGLDIRQEKGDELYGTVVANLGSQGYTRSWDLPEVTLGPDTKNRIYNKGIVLYEGPPADLNLVLQIVEHDHGDRAKVRQEVKRRVGQVFETAASAAGGAAGGAVGSALSSLQSESNAAGSLVSWLIGEAGGLVADVLGLGDDPYNPGGLTIGAHEMINIPGEQTYKCGTDPRRLHYTQRLALSGKDDGGDVGWISALVRVTRL